MPDAIDAAETAGLTELSHLLVQIVFYYHRRNKSRLKRRIDKTVFDAIANGWDKSLKQLNDEYFELENAANDVIPTLCSEHQQLFEPQGAG